MRGLTWLTTSLVCASLAIGILIVSKVVAVLLPRPATMLGACGSAGVGVVPRPISHSTAASDRAGMSRIGAGRADRRIGAIGQSRREIVLSAQNAQFWLRNLTCLEAANGSTKLGGSLTDALARLGPYSVRLELRLGADPDRSGPIGVTCCCSGWLG